MPLVTLCGLRAQPKLNGAVGRVPDTESPGQISLDERVHVELLPCYRFAASPWGTFFPEERRETRVVAAKKRNIRVLEGEDTAARTLILRQIEETVGKAAEGSFREATIACRLGGGWQSNRSDFEYATVSPQECLELLAQVLRFSPPVQAIELDFALTDDLCAELARIFGNRDSNPVVRKLGVSYTHRTTTRGQLTDRGLLALTDAMHGTGALEELCAESFGRNEPGQWNSVHGWNADISADVATAFGEVVGVGRLKGLLRRQGFLSRDSSEESSTQIKSPTQLEIGYGQVSAWTASNLPLLCSVLDNNPQISKFTLVFGPATSSDSVATLVRSLRRLHLQSLSVAGCKLSDDAVEELIPALHSVTSISLNNNEIGPRGATAIANILTQPDCVLRELDLGSNNLGDAGVSALALSLTTNTSLVHLFLPHTKGATLDGIASLAEALENNCCLESLDLRHSLLVVDAGGPSPDHIFACFNEMLRTNVTVNSLYLVEHLPSGTDGDPLAAFDRMLRENRDSRREAVREALCLMFCWENLYECGRLQQLGAVPTGVILDVVVASARSRRARSRAEQNFETGVIAGEVVDKRAGPSFLLPPVG
jgi:Leucine Rich repeat